MTACPTKLVVLSLHRSKSRPRPAAAGRRAPKIGKRSREDEAPCQWRQKGVVFMDRGDVSWAPNPVPLQGTSYKNSEPRVKALG